MALTLNASGKAMLIYDRPLGFQPAWIETAADGRGFRIIGEEGQEYVAGHPHNDILARLDHLDTLILLCMENDGPKESFDIPMIKQNYG